MLLVFQNNLFTKGRITRQVSEYFKNSFWDSFWVSLVVSTNYETEIGGIIDKRVSTSAAQIGTKWICRWAISSGKRRFDAEFTLLTNINISWICNLGK